MIRNKLLGLTVFAGAILFGVSGLHATAAQPEKELSTDGNIDYEDINMEDNFVINKEGTLLMYFGDEVTVKVPDYVKRISEFAFFGNTSTKKIILPEGVTVIDSMAFLGCSELEEINLPSTLVSLNLLAFNDCSNLKQLTIPKNVIDLLWYNADDISCDNGIENIDVATENTVYSSIDGVVYNKNGSSLIYYPDNRAVDTYIVPDGVTSLSEASFCNARYLKHIVFNKDLKEAENENEKLSNGLFANGILVSIKVPAENTSFCDIDGVLFSKDKKRLIVYPEKKPGEIYIIPEGTTTIGSWAFYTDENAKASLKYVFIPSSVSIIEEMVGYIEYDYGVLPNENLTFFGEKGTSVEVYAKENDINFNSYDSKNEGKQLFLTRSCVTMDLNKTEELKTILFPLGAQDTITWSSSNTEVAAVNINGVVISKQIGTAVITASTSDGTVAACEVNVRLFAPIGIKMVRESSKTNHIKLSWAKVEHATSYDIYRCVDITSDYEKIGKTTKETFTDKKTEAGKIYSYKIVACNGNPKCDSADSSEYVFFIPNKPEGLKALKQKKGSILLSWNQDSLTDGFELYRSTKKDGNYKKVNVEQLNRNSTSYVDKKLKNDTYYYKVRSYVIINHKKVYSNYSDIISYSLK